MALTRDQFFVAVPPKLDSVDVPQLGGQVMLRELTAGERDAFEAAHVKNKERDFRARIVAATVCDADGARIFSAGDVPALSNLPATTLDPVFKAAVKINGLSDDDVKELEKNS